MYATWVTGGAHEHLVYHQEHRTDFPQTCSEVTFELCLHVRISKIPRASCFCDTDFIDQADT